MKKKIVLLLLASFMFNCLTPRLFLFSQEYDGLLSLVHNQPLLQYYFTLSSLPVNLVNKLLSEMKTPVASHKASDKNKTATTNSSADFSLPAITRIEEGKIPCNSYLPIPLSNHASVVLIGNDYLLQTFSALNGSAGGSILVLLISLLFVLLPRGSLSDDYLMKNYNNFLNPIWSNSGLGFSFVGEK
jgi:hypothetical protein